jgi:hypothetical protein
VSKETFSRLINQYSSEAEALEIEEARLQARDARRESLKQHLITVMVIALYVIVYFKHDEIRDTVANLLGSGEPEYQSIMAINDEINSEKPGGTDTRTDPTSRKGRLKEAMRRAKEHAAVVDSIMDDNLNASQVKPKKDAETKPKTP